MEFLQCQWATCPNRQETTSLDGEKRNKSSGRGGSQDAKLLLQKQNFTILKLATSAYYIGNWYKKQFQGICQDPKLQSRQTNILTSQEHILYLILAQRLRNVRVLLIRQIHVKFERKHKSREPMGATMSKSFLFIFVNWYNLNQYQMMKREDKMKKLEMTKTYSESTNNKHV